MNIRTAYGEIIRQERAKQKLTLQQVAERAYMSRSYLHEIERGKKEPSSEFLMTILNSLDIDFPSFFEEVADYLRKESVDSR